MTCSPGPVRQPSAPNQFNAISTFMLLPLVQREQGKRPVRSLH